MSNMESSTVISKEAKVSGLIAKYDPPLLDVGGHAVHGGYFER